MAGSKSSVEQTESASSAQRDSADESEDESEVLGEESPCGRWQKSREEVRQRDVPGIDNAFLAMDREEGTEVVWNEVQISEKKASKAQLDKIKQVFDNLTQLEHANIVKFHKYWTDRSDRPRVIFITEYMSSGSVKQFLKKTKSSNKPVKAWHKWCTQILSALSYLHSCDPPIIHGNLTCDTIFLQHNGLIKIGSVAPDAIYSHVKTFKEEARNFHYVAPEYAELVSTAADIYSFGICALEMAVLGISGNGETGHQVTQECVDKALEALENPTQKDFIQKCLEKDPSKRPTARELLFHPVLFEVHSLKLLAAHTFVKSASILPEQMNDDAYQGELDPHRVIAEISFGGNSVEYTVGDLKNIIELEKFLEDVKNGVYPLTAFAVTDQPHQNLQRAVSPEVAESIKSESPEPTYSETRTIININCQVKPAKDETGKLITIILRMDDNMNRNLTASIKEEDTPAILADELVQHGFICPADRDKVATKVEEILNKRQMNGSPPQLIPQMA